MAVRWILTLAVLIGATSVSDANARQATPIARGSVLAQGTIDLWDEPVVWRVAAIDTDRLRESPFPDPAGFLYAERRDHTYTNWSEIRVALGAGEAMFMPEGSYGEARSEAEGGSLLAITLVPDQHRRVTDGMRGSKRRLIGHPFVPPAGPYELELTHASLDPNEPWSLPASPYPVAVVVIDGHLRVGDDGLDHQRVAGGEAVEAAGGAHAVAGATGASLVVAALVPLPPLEPGAAVVGVRFFECQPEAQPPLGSDPPCSVEVNAVPDVRLTPLDDGERYSMQTARLSGGRFVWDRVWPGAYTLSAVSLPVGTWRYVVDDVAAGAGPDGRGVEPGLEHGVEIVVRPDDVMDISVYLIDRPPDGRNG